ncbi:hypothetical protein C2G38_2219907 [Gigaspora rosea]|uniref:ZSWIM1/3 RNaseH-like domain-containing protein n=1 Tax=Gigaspora rosea TaxID=44941 RepID=A0A397U4W8_9GLOM|nr:hypothetical protein C2G38_2219907 [Gigaspora rosea]
MDDYKAKGTVIAKQYGVKDTQDPKEQAVLLGVASTIMPVLLTKYPDLLALDSTSCRNSLNFLNTAFMVRSDERRGRVVATFVSDKETIPIVDLMFELNNIWLNPKWLAMDKWEPYLAAARKHFPNTQVVLCDWHEADALKEWFTKNLNDQCLRDRVFYQFRFVKRTRDQEEFDQQKTILLDAKKLQAAIGIANLVVAETIASYFQRYWFGDWVDESVASSSLKSYLRQKDTNGHKKDELKLPEKRGPKNKRKSRLVPGESIHLRDTILNMPYKNVKIVEIIGESKVIVDITFENSNTDRWIVQMADIIGYTNEQSKKKTKMKPISSSKDSYSNVAIFTMPYGGKKDTLFFTSTYPVDTSLTLMQSAFTHQNIYKQATAFALSNPNSRIHLLLQVLNLMKQKKWMETKKTQAPVLQESNYFETWLKIWQEPYIIPYGTEFKTMDEKGSINIPKNAFKIDKYTSVETGNVKLSISINDNRTYLENKDLPEEIDFSSEDVNIKQRYHLTGVSFCDGNHHIADVRLENVKNIGWYQYNGLGKTYRSRAIYIGSSRQTHKNN